VTVPKIEHIRLTDAEQQLFDRINCDERTVAGMHFDDPDVMFDSSVALTHLLLERDAIPDVRIRYFDDPKLNVGGHGKSRHAIFVGNGCRGDDVFRSPHFFKYLRYFVLGPDLPADVIAGFRDVVIADAGTSGMVLDQLRAYARAQMRHLKTPTTYGLHEEFFKLALECGVSDYVAESVRAAAQSIK
jgi:hypothetical protein